jgi:hypothetical protein
VAQLSLDNDTVLRVAAVQDSCQNVTHHVRRKSHAQCFANDTTQ